LGDVKDEGEVGEVTSEAIFFDFLEAGDAARFGSLAESMLETGV
jgi:hypothetical protein